MTITLTHEQIRTALMVYLTNEGHHVLKLTLIGTLDTNLAPGTYAPGTAIKVSAEVELGKTPHGNPKGELL